MNKHGKYVILREIDDENKGTIRSDIEALSHATYNTLLKGVCNAYKWLRLRSQVSRDTMRWGVFYALILGLLLLIAAGL